MAIQEERDKPLAAASLAARTGIVNRVNRHVNESPATRNLVASGDTPGLVHETCANWPTYLGSSRPVPYIKYGAHLDGYESLLTNAFGSSTESKRAVGNSITVPTFKKFLYAISLLIFLWGRLDGKFAAELPKIFHSEIFCEYLAAHAAEIQAKCSSIRVLMINNGIKPIVLYWLRHPAWIAVRHGTTVPFNDFSTRELRNQYWRSRLNEETWILPWWLDHTVGSIMNVEWLYSCAPTGTAVGDSQRENIKEAMELRFLRLVDATYIYQVDQDLSKDPQFDKDAKMVSAIWSGLNNITKAVEPDVKEFPALIQFPKRSKPLWRLWHERSLV